MAIIFDEVIGSVEPEPAAPADEQRQQEQPHEPDPAALRGQIQRIEQRAKRLRAD